MRNKILIIALLLITTLCYSQRNFSYAVEYNTEGRPIKEFQVKFAYWINNKDKFVVEYNEKTVTYTIKSEVKKETKNGSKFTQFDLIPDTVGDKPLVVQVFENKEYGIRMFSEAPVYYQLYD